MKAKLEMLKLLANENVNFSMKDQFGHYIFHKNYAVVVDISDEKEMLFYTMCKELLPDILSYIDKQSKIIEVAKDALKSIKKFDTYHDGQEWYNYYHAVTVEVPCEAMDALTEIEKIEND